MDISAGFRYELALPYSEAEGTTMEENPARQWAAQAVTILRAVDLLARPQGASNEELSAELGIGLRTVYRLKREIEELGFPLTEVDGCTERKKRYTLQADYVRKLPNLTVPDLRLSPSEVIALALLKGHAALFRGTAVEARLASAFHKLEALLPPSVPQRLASLHALLLPAHKFAKDYSNKGEVIDILTRGIVRQRTCEVEYHAFGCDKLKRYRIDPLHFFEQEGGLYLFVNVTRFGNIRVLAVERIRNITLSDAGFAYPADFDASALLESAFTLFLGEPVTVRVRLASAQARYIRERRWAGDQTLIANADGSVTLTLTASGWWDIKRWVLSFGAAAEVLEPEGLRRQVPADLLRAAGQYAVSTTCSSSTPAEE